MVIRAAANGPVIFALALANRQIVDARDPPPHQAMLVKFPIFVAVTPEPIAAVVVPFIGKAHGNAVVAPGPDLLDKAVVEFAGPFALKERNDFFAPLKKLGAVAPDAGKRVGERDFFRIARVPGILGQARLLGGGFSVKRGKGRAAHNGTLPEYEARGGLQTIARNYPYSETCETAPLTAAGTHCLHGGHF